MDDRVDLEVRRMMELLDALVRMSKRSRRSIEEELGLGSSGLSKILNGTVRLQVSHVLSVLAAIQVDPFDFVRAAFPRRRGKKSPLVEQLFALTEESRKKETPEPDGDEEAEREEDDELPGFEERVRLVLLRLLADRPQGAN